MTEPKLNGPAKVAGRIESRVTYAFVATRMFIMAGAQIFFPFLPIMAAGLGMSEVRLSRLISIQTLGDLLSPLYGVLADRNGYRRIVRFALLAGGVGQLIVAASGSAWTLVIGLVCIGIGLSGLPLYPAYLSHFLPFERRSRGLGTLEYSWALVGLVMIPFFGWLIDYSSWRVPFVIMGVVQLGAALAFVWLPDVKADVATGSQSGLSTWAQFQDGMRAFLDFGVHWRAIAGVLASQLLIKFSATIYNINFGSWLVKEYGLSASEIGNVVFFMGFADICGSGLVVFAGDRLGKRRSQLIALGCAAVLFAILPLWNVALVPAVVGIVLARWAVEFSIVAGIVLVSEQSAVHRGKVLTMRFGLGFFAAALALNTGPYLYERYGVVGFSLPAMVCMICAAVMVVYFAAERAPDEHAV